IDVANMTGRLGAEDLNAEVRQTIRRTMAEVNPDTILLGESTNDAASDFQGDAWHGAMTYAPFTRPLWSWLMHPGSRAAGGIGFAGAEVPAHTGVQFFAAHSRFVAGFPWRTRLGTLNALDTHDTPRFLTSAMPGTVPVAFGLAATLPGIPVVFAGDEFGLVGEDGEASRTPIPWQLLDDDGGDLARDTTALYSALIALRRTQPALNGGGIRWLHVGDDVLVFVRESAENSVLVAAGRGDFSVVIPAAALATAFAGANAPLPLIGAEVDGFDGVSLAASDDGITLSASGPQFAAWALSGVESP
ncbi:MAG: alpha-amylase family glycosyl hydrolase, partial [Microterricola sp.]